MTIYEEIAEERARQDAKHGGGEHDDDHTEADWRELRFFREGDIEQLATGPGDPEENALVIRKLLIEIAALTVAHIESLDRLTR